MYKSLSAALLVVLGLVAGDLLASRATAQAPSPLQDRGTQKIEDRGQRGAESRPGPGLEAGRIRRAAHPEVLVASDLRHAYDTLAVASVWLSSGQAHLAKDDEPLVDEAKEFYRQAHQAYEKKEYPRSAELALAAGAAARGTVLVLFANTKPMSNMPEPPEAAISEPAPGLERAVTPPPRRGGAAPGARPGERPAQSSEQNADRPSTPVGERGTAGAAGTREGERRIVRTPKERAEDLLRFVHRRLEALKKSGSLKERGWSFVDAAYRAYEQAQKAFDEKEYSRAINLAWGAEAWSHVPEHLMQAEQPAR
jgi:hypothetical protein